MRLLPLLGGLLAATLAPFAAIAEDLSTPRATLDQLYWPYVDGEGHDYFWLFSADLNAAYDAAVERNIATGDTVIDFDPVVSGQELDLADLSIAEPQIDGETATALVTFTNFGERQVLLYNLVKEADGWKVDDISSEDPIYGWTLTDVLAAED